MSNPTLNGQELELFRIGDYSALGKGVYTAADMQGVVDRYSSRASETPIAIGHIKSDSEPAFGWIKSVRFSGDKLYGTPHEVAPELDELHRQKKYKHRSSAFARDEKGQLYLHHVAVLGAVPPQVSGLKQAQFSGDLFQEFSDQEAPMGVEEQQKKAISDGIKDFFSGMFGDGKPKVVDSEELIRKATEAVEAKFAAELEKERKEREKVATEFSAFKANAGKTDAQRRGDAAVADLKSAGCWLPAYEHMGVPQLFSALAEHTETITFSAADKTEQKPDLLDALKGVLRGVGRIVPAGQKVTFSATNGELQSQALPDANGADVDPASVQFSAMVSKHAAEKNIGFNEAYRQLKAQGVKPQPGTASAGAI